MGAKYIELLLFYADDIRNSLTSVSDTLAHTDSDNYFCVGWEDELELEPFVNINFDNYAYDDLITVLEKIQYLYKNKIISEKQLQILNLVSDNIYYNEISSIVGISRRVVSKIFKETCETVAYYLGGHFTDEGFVEYMVNKYYLDETEIKNLQKYIYNSREE